MLIPNMNVRDQIQWHAEQIAKDVPKTREHWLAIGELYLRIERECLEKTKSPALNGWQLSAARKEWREGDTSPEAMGLATAAVSNATLLARHRLAVEAYFSHAKSKSSDPTRLVMDWKRWAVDIRQTEGKGKFTPEVREKFFPGISPKNFELLFPPAKSDPGVIRKINSLATKAESLEGTPEGETFLAKAESMADNLGLTVQQARERHKDEMTPQEKERAITEIQRFILRFSSKYPVGLYRAAATYMFNGGFDTPKKIENALARLNKEEC